MIVCRNCRGVGVLAAFSEDGLCPKCENLVKLDLESRKRELNQSRMRAESTINTKTKIAEIGMVVKHLEAIESYRKKGIRIPKEFTTEELTAKANERDGLVLKAAQNDLNKLLKAAWKPHDSTSKNKLHKEFLAKLAEIRAQLEDPSIVNEIAALVQEAIDAIQPLDNRGRS